MPSTINDFPKGLASLAVELVSLAVAQGGRAWLPYPQPFAMPLVCVQALFNPWLKPYGFRLEPITASEVAEGTQANEGDGFVICTLAGEQKPTASCGTVEIDLRQTHEDSSLFADSFSVQESNHYVAPC